MSFCHIVSSGRLGTDSLLQYLVVLTHKGSVADTMHYLSYFVFGFENKEEPSYLSEANY